MSNPFEDLRQAVVVRPMNSPGPQGAAAPDMKIQYSYDGQSWHDDPLQTDRYLRFSTDNGVSWSDAVYFNNLYETLGWVDKARRWAINPEDLAVEPGKYSALHYASKAENAAINAATDAAEAATELIEPSIEKARQWAENPENSPVIYPDQYSALHHATKAARSEANAEAAALDAAGSAVEAFGAAAPAWDSGTIYNYNDVVSFDNGHTYRCIGINIVGEDHAPNINGKDNEEEWTRITVAPDGFFELDEYGNLMPRLTPLVSELFTLDENGDIMHKDPIDIEFGEGELYPASGKLEFIDSIHDFRNASFVSTTENVYLSGYYGTGTPGGGMFYKDTESSEADNGGTVIVDGDGIRWKRANITDGVYYASWFGISTDIDDNSPLIQNALEAIPSYSVLVFGPGTYECKQPIIYPDVSVSSIYVKHIGLGSSVKRSGYTNSIGTKLKYTGPNPETLTPFFDFRGSTGDKRYLHTISDIIFEGPGKDSNIVGLWFYICVNSVFERVACNDFKNGIQIDNYFYYAYFNDVACARCDYGFKSYGTGNHAVFNYCTFSVNNVGFAYGLNSGGGSGISLNDCYFEGNETAIQALIHQSIRITRCYFEHNIKYNIDIECSREQSQPIIYLNNSYFCFWDSNMPSPRAIIRIMSTSNTVTSCVLSENVLHKGSNGYIDYFIYATGEGNIIIKAENNVFGSSSDRTLSPICSKVPLETSYFNNQCFS